MLAPLSSIALLTNIGFATVLLGEKLNVLTDCVPIAFIAVGNFFTIMNANHKAYKNLSLDEITRLFNRSQFKIYLGIVGVVIMIFWGVKGRIERRIRKNGGKEYANPSLIARQGLVHASAGCMLSVHIVFLSKASMLALAEGLDNVLRFRFLGLVTSWVVLAVFWIYTLNKLLGEYEALFIVPVIEVVWSLQSMISGGIFFNEYKELGVARLLAFVEGVGVNVCGVYLLSKRGERSKKLAE